MKITPPEKTTGFSDFHVPGLDPFWGYPSFEQPYNHHTFPKDSYNLHTFPEDRVNLCFNITHPEDRVKQWRLTL